MDVERRSGWLSREDLDNARERLPILYVDAVPVMVNTVGAVTHVGLLLRAMPDGSISRAIVSGRVLYNERVRDALMRHLEKDLGPLAMPQLPASPQPFAIVEYFPDGSITGFHDPRQHAVSLGFVVPCKGECVPSQGALEFTWLTPEECLHADVRAEMTGGQDKLVMTALAHVGVLP
jgi:ADP-ribose pyrophosphatase YjhB (NUDIX family)